jgi:uncharacterized protein YndB with AHSA1/START domain
MTYELKVERILTATAEEVFDALTDAEAMRQWFRGPDDPPDMIVEVSCDPRVGGTFVAAWGETADRIYRETNVFTVVERPRQLAMRTTTTSPEGDRLDTEVDIRLEERDGRTRVTIVQRGFPQAEVRDYFAGYAWPGALDRIERYLRERERS